jgi:hypothetical protein
MKRTLTLALSALVLGAAALAPGRAALAGDVSYSDFQKDMAPWKANAAEAKYITEDSLKLKQEENSLVGGAVPNGFAALTKLEGNMVWMQLDLQATASKVRVEFQARDREGCGACIALAYVGTAAPRYPGDFGTDFQALEQAWSDHKIEIDVPSNTDGAASLADADAIPKPNQLFVAISFTNLDDRPIVPDIQGIDIDNVLVTILDEETTAADY